MIQEDVERIAEVAHEVNRAYCQSIGDDTQPTWDNAPDWQRESAVNGVVFHLHSDASPRESHENWLAVKRADNWIWGPVKDPDNKEHPCMVDYDELPVEQKTKDYLFRAVVQTMRQYYY